jgi:hypothetical protein
MTENANEAFLIKIGQVQPKADKPAAPTKKEEE